MAVLLETSVGDMVVDLFVDDCPRACFNFLKLCKLKIYHNSKFFHIEKDFVAKAGDPTDTGDGGLCVWELLRRLNGLRQARELATPSRAFNVEKLKPSEKRHREEVSKGAHPSDQSGALITTKDVLQAARESHEGSNAMKTEDLLDDSNVLYPLFAAGRYMLHEIKKTRTHSRIGMVGMVPASGKDNGIGSQFYITLRDDIKYLDGRHTIIGSVEEGVEDVLRSKLNVALVETGTHRPLQDIRIFRAVVLDDPYSDKLLNEVIPGSSSQTNGEPSSKASSTVQENSFELRSPSPIREDVDATTATLGSRTNSTEHEFELIEKVAEKEAAARAVTLEILGDIPDADAKPPDNVLFVCKLNPVTEEEDLNILFSRFGEIQKCSIIKDWKTGDSLQYGFVEFEDSKSCEEAYFKMQNVLVDDRRIHVDFCQSFHRQWQNYKKNGTRGVAGEFDRAPNNQQQGDEKGQGQHDSSNRPSKPAWMAHPLGCEGMMSGRGWDVKPPGMSTKARKSRRDENDESDFSDQERGRKKKEQGPVLQSLLVREKQRGITRNGESGFPTGSYDFVFEGAQPEKTSEGRQDQSQSKEAGNRTTTSRVGDASARPSAIDRTHREAGGDRAERREKKKRKKHSRHESGSD